MLFLSIITLATCSKTPPATNTQDGTTLPYIAPTTLNLLDHPDGDITQSIEAGTGFQASGQISNELYFRRVGQDSLLEPYLEIILADGSKHWLYAHPAYFGIHSDIKKWQWSNRLRAILSPDEYRTYQQVQNSWHETSAQQPFLLVFQATRLLRDQIEKALTEYPMLPADDYMDVLPGCLSYSKSGRPSWWLDFNQWLLHAKQSGNLEAEQALMAFYTHVVYPPDGIEYHFPVWQFPISPQKAHSLLGRGIHLQLLHELDSLETQYPFVSAEWDRLRNFLLEDLTSTSTTYWEAWASIDNELQKIIAADGSILSAVAIERIELHHKRLGTQPPNSAQFDHRNR